MLYLWFISLFILPCSVLAQPELPAPTGTVILTITGNISVTNREGAADFDDAMLAKLPQHSFTTKTPWTAGEHTYKGIKLSDLLERLDTEPKQLFAMALNHYSIEFDYSAVKDYPILIAQTLDGEPMSVSDKGPLWILYPMSDHPELDKPHHHHSMVWQLRSIEVR